MLHKASQESRHILDPQNTVTFDASYCTRKSYKDTIDALFSESTNTPKSIDSSEGFFGFISRLNQQSLPLQKVKQSSQLHAKILYRKNKASFFISTFLCCHRSFPHFHKIKILRLNFPNRKRLPQPPTYVDKNYLYSHRMSFSQENLQIFHFKRYNVKNVILPYKYVFIRHLVFGNRSMAEFRKANPKWIITTNSGFAYLHTPIWYLYLETVASGLTSRLFTKPSEIRE